MPINTVRQKTKVYKYESYWREEKRQIIRDSKGNPFPFPKPGVDWQNRKLFMSKLEETEEALRTRDKFQKYDKDDYRDCLICGRKNVGTGMYELNNFRWEDSLMHYINKHNIEPSENFMDLIFRFQIDPRPIARKAVSTLKGVTVVKQNKQWLKIDRNQIMIMDALMEHGSRQQYIDKRNRRMFRYSEHAGLLDFDDNGLEKLVISGKTFRVDKDDDDIYLPTNMKEAFDYEYIFHTHPATPKPGGRVKVGILYEFPSISDVFHFMDHYNQGKTQGSIIIAAEGMYIVRKAVPDNKKIRMDENKFYHATIRTYGEIQNESIRKYGTKFTNRTFFSKIAQNTSYIERINRVTNRYGINIDYYPRTKDSRGRWIIDTVYVPVYSIEAE